ncbi:MAG: protein TolR [Geminicoccaceae bacterium]|nr:protein TolR [Geminicoccaceae bacterium]MCX8102039.1 protein TolR [Geminicoccaceae bacterium]
MPKTGGRRARRRRRSLSEINVTPFVDVMLVLLIVFMVTAPLLTTGVSVDLPQARSAPLPGQDEPLTVTIKADSTIWLQESAIALDELGPRLAAVKARNPELRVFVRGDKNVDYGRVMAVVSTINQAGIGKVALVTEAPRTTAELGRGQGR